MSEVEMSDEERKLNRKVGLVAKIGKALFKASGETKSASPGTPGRKTEKVLFAQAAAPKAGTAEVKGPAAPEPVDIQAELEKAAEKLGKKSFEELSIDQKVDVLTANTKDLGTEGALIQQKLHEIQIVLQKTPIEDQWTKIELIMATMPDEFRTSKDPALKSLRRELYHHLTKKETLEARGFVIHKDDDEASRIEAELKHIKDAIGYKPFWEEKYGMKEPVIIEGAVYTPFKLGIRADLPVSPTQANKDLRKTLGIYQLQLNNAHGDEEAFAILQGLSKQLQEGIVPKMDPKTLALEKPMYNRREAEIFRAKIDNEIARIEKTHQRTNITNLRSQDAEHFALEIEELQGVFSSSDYARIRDHWASLPDDEQRGFLQIYEKDVHKIVERLEQNKSEPWRIGGIEDFPRDLYKKLIIIAEINPEKYKKLLKETQARSWLHQIAHAIRTGSSPQDTKEVLMRMQELDEMEYFTHISKLTGVNEGWKLLEQHADELMRSEVRPEAREALFKQIAQELGNDPTIRQQMEDEGITPRTALEVAERFWITTGREAAKYKEYAETNKLYVFEEVKDSRGKKHIVVKTDPNAEWKLDSMRLAMMFPILVAEFHMGSTTKGSLKNFTVNGHSFKDIISGQGVGADVFSKLMENGLNLNIQDWWSRRFNDYILPAWISQKLDTQVLDQNGLMVARVWTPAELAAGYDQDAVIWNRRMGDMIPEPGRGNIISGDAAQNLDVRLLFLQKDLVKAKFGIRFSTEFGTQVKGFSGEWAENVKTLRRDARGNAAMLLQLDQLDAQFTALQAQMSARNIAMMRSYRPTDIRGHVYTDGELEALLKSYGDYIPTMGNYNIKEIPFERTPRLQENVRGNLRDTISELGVVNKVIDFINNPNLEHLMAFEKGDMTSYTHPDAFEVQLMIPVYLAFCDVQRGKGILGYDYGLTELFRSKYGKIYDIRSLNDKELYKIGQALIGKGNLSRDQLYHIRGEYLGVLRDKSLQYYDPISLFILFAGVAQHESQEMQKDASKS